MIRFLCAFACLVAVTFAGPARQAFAQDNPGATAQAAADALRAARAQLDASSSARDRVKALTSTVQAFETGLAAMREGLRLAAIREEALSRQLEARDAEIAALLGALTTISRAPTPVLLAHPDGPSGAVRSGILLAEVTPALSRQADELRALVEEVTLLRNIQSGAQDDLTAALSGVQDARTALSQAMADRSDLPRKFTADPVRTAILISTTETLDAFADGLTKITTTERLAPLPDVSDRKGGLPLPAEGRVLRRMNEVDAAGIARPGVILATRPKALVTTPAAATIRYHGPLLNYGNVVILEPQSGVLFVLAGLDQLFGDIGQVLPEGFPIGLMGGDTPRSAELVSQDGEGAGQTLSETLYIEVREENKPVDPLSWFRTDKD